MLSKRGAFGANLPLVRRCSFGIAQGERALHAEVRHFRCCRCRRHSRMGQAVVAWHEELPRHILLLQRHRVYAAKPVNRKKIFELKLYVMCAQLEAWLKSKRLACINCGCYKKKLFAYRICTWICTENKNVLWLLGLWIHKDITRLHLALTSSILKGGTKYHRISL